MNFKTFFIIALILFLIPVVLGKVDINQIKELLKNPSQLTDIRILKLVFGDLVKGVINYYKGLGQNLIGKIFGTAKQEIQKKQLEIKIQ